MPSPPSFPSPRSASDPSRTATRTLAVHLAPGTFAPEALAGSVAVLIDILRASTTIIHALACGAKAIFPTKDVDDSFVLARQFKTQPLLAGERDCLPISGFDLGNSPGDFTPDRCTDRSIVMNTTNGTRVLEEMSQAERIVVGAFVNFSAICEELERVPNPIHLICAGNSGRVALEDALFAGAIVDFLMDREPFDLNDGARMAWDAYEHHGRVLVSAFELSESGQRLLGLGLDEDLKSAASVDRFGLVPEVITSEPLRIIARKAHLDCRHFRGDSGLMD